ncbi:IBR domain-containing protein [Nannizzia gypsea CBS 118893]|uniref:RBR-type E3 ubiquitin transferase n=1 Tax=Arthroderma gypseum (strain ATCC MYA-4604 / CBS 118893) TaxID=535722 RepID=E4V2T6_ARTGP|nr:IBR domain-containing protein [Nannizzia gypsea CBS 118893]EFR04310.1 IBR domain-containing protein [Nannizzia gypsea CBS 118893]
MSVPQLTRDLEAPLQGLVDDADRLAEWPELVGLEDLLLDNGQLPSHRADRPCPQELHVFPDDVSPELLQIISQPLETEQPPRSADRHSGNEDGRSQPPPSSYTGDDRSSLPVRTQAPAVKDHTRDNHLERCLSPESTATGATFSRMGHKATKETKNLKLRLLERNNFRECASCFVELLDKNLVPLSCSHKYCLSCFSGMIETAINNESKFPPKCCLEDIPTKLILHNVDSVLREEYKLKAQEYAIPRMSRWYCPSPNCGKWIPPKKIKLGAPTQKCPICKWSICTACQRTAHQNNEHCPQAPYPERIDSIASNGWRRCYKCQAMVDLTADSGSVVCHCGAEFCCFCGARGGTCGCVQPSQYGTKSRAESDTIMHRERAQLAAIVKENERSERREVEERLRKEDTQKLPDGDGQRRQDDGRRRVQHDKEMKRLISIANQIQKLQGELAKINKIQQSMIIDRHQDSAQQIQVAAVSKQADFDQTRVKLEKAYESNFKLRKSALEVRQNATKLELRTRQEEDEDDNFVQMQRHLKGKPNREEREKVILDKLNASHKREQDALDKSHKEEMSELEYHGSLESSALQSGIMKKLGDLQRETNFTLYELSSTVISDRRWFKVAVEKRYGLLEEHRMFLINGPDAIKDTATSSSRYSSANNSSHSGTTYSVTSGRETPQSPLSPPPVFTEFGYRRSGPDALKTGGDVIPGSRSRSMSRNGLRHVSSQSQFLYR